MVALSEVTVDIVVAEDKARFRDVMQAHHYLGMVPGMGETCAISRTIGGAGWRLWCSRRQR